MRILVTGTAGFIAPLTDADAVDLTFAMCKPQRVVNLAARAGVRYSMQNPRTCAQPGDVPDTWADVTALRRDMGYAPNTSIEDGVAKFAQWYREYSGR